MEGSPLEITYNNNTEARTLPKKHLLILKELGTAFDNTELELYDNKNRKLSLEACKAMANIEHYKSHFKIHQGNGRHYNIPSTHYIAIPRFKKGTRSTTNTKEDR
jgi:hypothetical protein